MKMRIFLALVLAVFLSLPAWGMAAEKFPTKSIELDVPLNNTHRIEF